MQPNRTESQKQITISPADLQHIFRNAPGHLPDDTPQNRQLLIDTASDANNYLGSDKYHNEWYAQIRSDGSQIWVKVRNNVIKNGGINQTPRTFSPITGLSRPAKPTQK